LTSFKFFPVSPYFIWNVSKSAAHGLVVGKNNLPPLSLGNGFSFGFE